jgi:hypothetical protein
MEAGKAMTGTRENDGTPPRIRGGVGWWRIALWGGAAALLLAPLVAMRVTDEVVWTGSDFALVAAMLGVAGGAFELAVRMRGDWAYRTGAGLAIVTAFLLVWVNIAVGYIGDEDDPINLLFAGVLAIAIGGGAVAGWRPGGLARALVATAIAQALAGGYGVVSGRESIALLAPTAVFTALWLASAWLFRRAAAASPSAA